MAFIFRDKLILVTIRKRICAQWLTFSFITVVPIRNAIF